MKRAHHSGSEGQTLIIFALAFALVLFGLTCVVADTAVLDEWSDRAQAAAQLAAQSGADAVDPRYLYGGSCTAGCTGVIVDISEQDRESGMYAFQRACEQAGDQSAQVASGTICDSDGCRVFAEVTRVVGLPLALPGFPSSVTVRGTAYAAPVVGQTRAVSTCSGVGWVPQAPP
jgi:hypothetical protein